MVAQATTRTITHNPKVLSGQPIVSGTRVPVRAVVVMARAYHNDLVSIQRALPTLTEDEITLALGYARDHPDEIAYWIRDDEEADRETL